VAAQRVLNQKIEVNNIMMAFAFMVVVQMKSLN